MINQTQCNLATVNLLDHGIKLHLKGASKPVNIRPRNADAVLSLAINLHMSEGEELTQATKDFVEDVTSLAERRQEILKADVDWEEKQPHLNNVRERIGKVLSNASLQELKDLRSDCQGRQFFWTEDLMTGSDEKIIQTDDTTHAIHDAESDPITYVKLVHEI